MRETCGTPAIALTGYGRADDVEHSRAAGFDAHLTKPVDLSALIATVERLAATAPGGGGRLRAAREPGDAGRSPPAPARKESRNS